MERALAYPFQIPDRSFLQAGERTLDLAPGTARLGGRTAVLALGSNASPPVLARKLGLGEEDEPVPVIRAELRDFDVVYSAHLSAYGSLPAAVQVSPGTGVAIHVLFLGDEQLEAVAATEPNYDPVVLEGIRCRLGTGDDLDAAVCFLSKHGCLQAGGAPLALAAIRATGRRFAAASEPEALERVRAQLAPGLPLDRFVAENVEDQAVREERNGALAAGGVPFAGRHRPT